MTTFNENNFRRRLKNCRICPVECGTNRTTGRGKCGAGDKVEISSWNLHFGEEPVISGKQGSGTIFFTHCSLRCIFCQNYPISHMGNGSVCSLNELADIMLNLQSEGAHNINLVTPTHYLLHIKEVLRKLRPRKLKIPIVYNCGGYEKKETLRELEGLVDIYMPDAKFALPEVAKKLTGFSNYPAVNREALKEMYRQAGNVKIGKDGLMKKG
ncbi:MAG: radical SAM protein, partial [Elusimicrobiota bacterium]|nr:radical SAM protein [Elusimicrobiota bacterium]